MNRSVPLFVITAALLAGHAHSQDLDSAARYRDCLAQIERNADVAYDAALDWQSRGGGAAAKHCAALALVELELYGEAAVRLGALADEPDAGGPEARAAILGQAGNAWLLAGGPQNAVTAFDAALGLAPGDPALLIDRARAQAAQENYAAAESDLSQAIAADPANAAAFVLRASARREQGLLEQALADIERALRLVPDAPNALAERAAIRLAQGDEAGARADWVRVAQIVGEVPDTHPHAPALHDAQRGLELLDVERE